MPYIVTTYADQTDGVYGPESQPYAVATLEEACDAASEEGDRSFETIDGPRQPTDIVRAIDALPEHGGTVGPLPDGYVIEVQQVEWIELARLVELDCGALCAVPNAEIIDAYNAGH